MRLGADVFNTSEINRDVNLSASGLIIGEFLSSFGLDAFKPHRNVEIRNARIGG